MVQSGEQAYAKFSERINQYKAPPPGGAITEHFNRTMPEAGFVGGYTIEVIGEVIGPHPLEFVEKMATGRGLWGAGLRCEMLDYNHFSGLGMVGAVMPTIDNEVKLHETERDRYGLPVPHIIFSHRDNDKRLIQHSEEEMTEILMAAGGEDIWSDHRMAHYWAPAGWDMIRPILSSTPIAEPMMFPIYLFATDRYSRIRRVSIRH